MSFTKHRATQSDVEEIEKRFGSQIVRLNKAFVINSERDCLLYYIGQDRFDMGGTTNTYWILAYRNKVYEVATDMGRKGPDYGRYEFNMIITSIEEGNPRHKVLSVDQDFIDTFAQAYYIFQKYGDINPQEETGNGNHIYHFHFEGAQA